MTTEGWEPFDRVGQVMTKQPGSGVQSHAATATAVNEKIVRRKRRKIFEVCIDADAREKSLNFDLWSNPFRFFLPTREEK